VRVDMGAKCNVFVDFGRPEPQARSDAKRPSLAQMVTAKSKSVGSSPAPVKFKLKKTSEIAEEEEEEASFDRAEGSAGWGRPGVGSKERPLAVSVDSDQDTASGKLEKTASFVSDGDSGHESPGARPSRHQRKHSPSEDVKRSLSRYASQCLVASDALNVCIAAGPAALLSFLCSHQPATATIAQTAWVAVQLAFGIARAAQR
jgi:hypothetical protein